MKIESIHLSVFEMASNTGRFDLVEKGEGLRRRWIRQARGHVQGEVHVLHVRTDEGVEGMCTVGDARYTAMRPVDLEQLRVLAIGEDPFDRERLNRKLMAATRGMFATPGWHGAFDNCLWDIAGKTAGLPVCALIGKARARCPAYFNFASSSIEAAVAHGLEAVDHGFPALKDHFAGAAPENIRALAEVRKAVGDEIDLLHDAAGCSYSLRDALAVGEALQDLEYGWFEEPLADRDQEGLRTLCAALDIPILAPESMMHDVALSALWLRTGATDWLRANARHGTTNTLKLANLCELYGANIELNGPGGLFGLVHVHLVCAVGNTGYYEYFPGGSRDEIGREIGLTNPPLPVKGYVTPPALPGWGAEWDLEYFNRRRTAYL